MKKVIITLIGFWIIASGSVVAQSGMTEAQKQVAKAKFQEFQANLNLSEQQTEQVEAINLSYFEGLSALKHSQNSRLTKYRKFKDLSATRDNQMKQVLDKDQYKKYKEFQSEMREEFKNNRRGN